MYEKFPTNSQEHPTEAEIRSNFELKEKEKRNDAVSFLENLEPEKFKNKAASALLALTLFASASSAFAEEQGLEKESLPAMGEEDIVQTLEKLGIKNRVADFDWGKVAGKIEFSVSGKKEDTQDFHAESINNGGGFNGASEFYKDITSKEVSQAYSFNYFAISNSQNSAEFFNNLGTSMQGASDIQKAVALQQLGALLGETYNLDMLASNTHVEISDDAMFQALRNQYLLGDGTSGICGNIHTFLVRAAQSMGIEAFLQSGSTSDGGHVWGGLVLGDGAEKQIVFLDYGTLLPTGTLNYRDALGVGERYHGSVSMFNNWVGNENEVLFPVESRSSQIIQEAAGVENTASLLGRNLQKGEIAREERGLYININPEIKTIKLNADTVTFAFTHLEDSQNPYLSLKSMDALRGNVSFHGENLGVQAGVAVLNLDVKGLNDEKVSSSSDLVGTLMLDFLKKEETSLTFTKEDYGKIVAELGVTVTEAIKMSLGHEGEYLADMTTKGESKDTSLESRTEGAIGTRFMYLDPNNMGKVYLDTSWVLGVRTNNFSEQKSDIKTVTENIVIGAEVKVFEGSVMNLEVGKSNLEWGDSVSVKAGMAGESLKGRVGYEKKNSDHERFVPSSEKIEVGASYQIGPKWEVDVIAAKTAEKYKDADSKNIYNAQVKLKMLLW